MTSLRHRREDLLIAAALAIFLTGDVLSASHVSSRGLTLLVLMPAALAVALRRERPLVPMVVVAVTYSLSGFLATGITDLSATLPIALVAAYAVGRYGSDMRLAGALAAATIVLVNVGSHKGTLDDWVFPAVAFGGAMLTGRALRTRALVAAELAERTERLAVEQDLRAAEAALHERRRIARELHDVVAHTLSVMVVQAGAARRTLDRDPDRSQEALETVEATGRAALGELRRMLGFVGEGAAAAPAAPLDPQPTTADLGALTRRAGAAGLPTELRVEGEPGHLPAGEEVAVYRIVQEALTNALKHAGPGAVATVTVRWSREAVEVEVVDRGGAGHAGVAALPSGGHGLVGMRERVALFRGAFAAGPAGGGFRVRGAPAARSRDGGRVIDPVRVVIADDQQLVRTGFRHHPRGRGRPRRRRRGRRRAGGRRGRRPRAPRRRADGHPHARARRHRGHAPDRRLGARAPACSMLTTFDLNEYVYEALRAGASGFLLKDTPAEQLAEGIRVVARGDALLAPSVTRRLLDEFARGGSAAPAEAPPAAVPGLDELTSRELEVFRLLARGLSNAEIAAELVVSETTVKTHVARVLMKLGLRDRVQAVVLAYESGVVTRGAA